MAPIVAKTKAMMGKLSTMILPIPVPKIVSGEGCSGKMGQVARELNITKVLIVTDEILTNLGVLNACMMSLKDSNIEITLFNKVLPDPSVDTAREGLEIYLNNGCNGIIAFGGGSPMDCAKMIGILSTNPSKDPKKFMGTIPLTLAPFGKPMPPLIAVPTTAGTGSEATIAAVITFPAEKKKYNVIDPKICPRVAVLDPELLRKLPPSITAATGMDALTHAVESFVGPWRNKFTSEYSLKSVEAIFKNLDTCYKDGNNIAARQAMLKASFDAGVAFTRAGVGYVHAIAHQFGALFHVPHGVANAMVLPHILDFYQLDCTESFAELAIAAGLREGNESNLTLASKFTQAVKKMHKDLQMPTYVKGMSASDVKTIAERAINECHGNVFSIFEAPFQYFMDVGYPVPKYMTLQECEEIVSKFVDPSARMTSKL